MAGHPSLAQIKGGANSWITRIARTPRTFRTPRTIPRTPRIPRTRRTPRTARTAAKGDNKTTGIADKAAEQRSAVLLSWGVLSGGVREGFALRGDLLLPNHAV